MPNRILREIYTTHTVRDATDNAIPVAENVTLENAEALYRAVLREQPSRVLEIGMATGVCSLAILTALGELGNGNLISVDPYQSTDWGGVGVLNIERSGLAGLHKLREQPDYLALPALLHEGEMFDMAYIDGWHNFEYALLDFFYIDKLLNVGGVVGFNDCDWPGVLRVIRFAERHRHYERIDVGLRPRWGDRGRKSEWVHRALNRVRPGVADSRLIGPFLGRRREDRYLRKLNAWEPPHGYWADLDSRLARSARRRQTGSKPT